MPTVINSWPPWTEYTLDNAWPEAALTKETEDPNEEFKRYKKDLVSIYGEKALRKSWLKVCNELESLTKEIAKKGTTIIPEVGYDELFNMGEDEKREFRKRGCFVVRGVISEEQATKYFKDLKEFIKNNKENITGWPMDNPMILNLFWSPTQLAIRSHPNQLRLQRKLNSWWHDDTATPKASPDPLAYADAVRIRPPGVPFTGLGPHMDAGSMCRWVDPAYRKVYEKIFSGNPELHDYYDMSTRKSANQSIFDPGWHSTVLRSFQGWTALTGTGKGRGSLLLYPDVKNEIAYILLRPFFSPPEDGSLDPTKWKFDAESSWFPGTFKNDSQYASPSSHPHLKMRESMVHIPDMNPGDTLWWHSDMLHAVEVKHDGDHEASVAYVAATPTTEGNLKYMKKQVDAFLDDGRCPEDFWYGRKEEDCVKEGTFKGWNGVDGIISEEGRRAAGLMGL